MAPTLLTATPDLDTATVRLEIDGPPNDYPTDVLTLSAGQLKAEASAWTGHQGATLYDEGLVSFYTDAASGAQVRRVVTGLTIGARYRLTLRCQRTDVATTFGVTTNGAGTIPAGSGTWAHSYEWVAGATSQTLFFTTYLNSNPLIASVQLTKIPSLDYDLAQFSLTRTDANGARPVRLLDGQEIIDGTLIVEDAEVALVGPVTYALTTASGARYQASTSLAGATGYRLAPAVFPQFAVTLGLLTGYAATRGSATVVHYIRGRPDAVVRPGPLQLRAGSLTIWCADYLEATAVLDVYRRGEVVHLRQPDNPGLDLYHVALEVEEAGYDEIMRRWRLDVKFVEVAYPRGPLLGSATWTWDDLAALCPTWDDVARLFATWNAAQIGPLT